MKAFVSSLWLRLGLVLVVIAATLVACSSREGAPAPLPVPKSVESVGKAIGSLSAGPVRRVGDPSLPANRAEPRGNQMHPAVAFGDGIFFAIWTDERLTGSAIYGARFLEDGTPLDPSGFIINQERRASLGGGNVFTFERLTVTYTDGGFLALWQDPLSRTGRDIRGRRYKVDATTHALTAIDDTSFFIDATYTNRYRVAANAHDFIVVFDVQEAVGGYNAYSRLIAGPKSGNPNPVGPKTRLTKDSLFHLGYQKGGGAPSVASNGDQFFVITAIDDNPYYGHSFLRLNAAGQPIEEPTNNLALSRSWDARLVYFNHKYHLFDAYGSMSVIEYGEDGKMLNTIDGHSTYYGEYYFANGYDRVFAATSTENAIFLTAARSDGVDCVMRFVDTANYACTPISPWMAAANDDSNPLRQDRAVAASATKTFAGFTRNGGASALDTRFALFDSNFPADAGTPSSEPLSKMGASEGESATSYDGKGTFVLWAEGWNVDFTGFTFGMHGNAAQLVGAYFDANGNRVSAPTKISSNDSVYVSLGSTVFDGTKHYATWLEVNPDGKMRVYGRTIEAVNGDLVLGTITEIAVANPSQGEFLVQTAMASDGVNRIVVFIKGLLTLPNSQTGFVAELFGKRVSIANDAVLDPEPVLLSDGTFSVAVASPAIACDKSAGQCVVGWAQAAQGVLRHVHGVVIKKGEIAPAAPSFYFQNTAGAQFMTALASNDAGRGIVSYVDYGTDGNFTVYAKVFDFNHPEKVDAGARGIEVSPLLGEHALPSVAYMNDSASFTIAWSHKEADRPTEMRAASVSFDGRVLDPGGVVVSASPNESDDCPTIAPSAPGKATLIYSHLDLSATEGGPRVEMRTISSGKFASDSCETNDDCATRFCAGEPGNKVCCDTACTDACGTCVAPGKVGTCTPRGDTTRSCGFDGASRCTTDSPTCPATCTASNQCAPGAECKSDSDASASYCTFAPISCFDETAEKGLDGSRVPCANNLKCSAGKCLPSCGSVDDCTAGFVCQVDGKCVGTPEIANENGSVTGCDCSFGGTSGSAYGAVGFAIGALVVARRRKSKRVSV